MYLIPNCSANVSASERQDIEKLFIHRGGGWVDECTPRLRFAKKHDTYV
jgi:hypothetical protein